MSTSAEPHRARHAAPRATFTDNAAHSAAFRRAAYAAAAVVAGTVPLASVGTAHAATGPLGLALSPAQAVTTGAQQLTGPLTSALPLGNLIPAVLPDSGDPLDIAPNLLHDGALGTLSRGLGSQTQDITGAVIGQTTPLVNRLHEAGVPTVGDVTSQVSKTALPDVGTVGGLTRSLPVTSVLGPNGPVTGALNNLGRL